MFGGGGGSRVKLRTVLIMVVALIALAVAFYFSSRPKPVVQEEPQYFVWDVEMDELQTMQISLIPTAQSETWVKHEDRYWYFDVPDGPKVDMQRWGGGVPLLLSGPGANRRLTEEVTDEQLKIYGLEDPRMLIHLTLENGNTIDIELGDGTPDRQAYYIRLAGSQNIYTVDYTWHDVLARLVTEPPYPKPDAE
jgi:hypothetical protein